jgi:hypothetical protein
MENLLRGVLGPTPIPGSGAAFGPFRRLYALRQSRKRPPVVRQQPYSAALTRTLAMASSTEGRSIANTVSGVTTAYSM